MPPFDGDCLHCDDQIELCQLRTLLTEIVNLVSANSSETSLYRLDDWHEHDGIITERTVVDWDSIDKIHVSDDSLYESRHGDSYVNWAHYPDDCSFLIRFDLLDADEAPKYPGIWGYCDLCAASSLIQTVKFAAPDSIGSKLAITNAKDYFDQHYAG